VADDKPPDDPFTDLLTRLVRVPKEEIDEQEQEYQERKNAEPAKHGAIVPKHKGGPIP
jgi:hypothetical protein